jgi:carboxylate-amine ligase
MHDWHHFAEEVKTLKRHGIIAGVRDLWWDTRPCPDFGTIEVRICDLPSRFRDILAIVSFIQAAVAWIVEEEVRTSRLDPYIVRANIWQALRHGFAGRFVDPTKILTADPVTIGSAVELLLAKVSRYGEKLGSGPYLQEFTSIVSKGSGADRQRHIYQKTGDLREVVRMGHQGFWQ